MATALAPGAVRLPMAHLSVRVPWHDTDWTGRVCAKPAENHACAILKNVKANKNSEAEEALAGKDWNDLEGSNLPPCVFERGGFMRTKAFSVERTHAYARRTASHAHFAPTHHRMPAYSIEATPYRWVMREEVPGYAALWGIGYDASLEEQADQQITFSKKTAWVQDHRNQLALLDSFFSALKPAKSLVFFYAKDVPLLEDRPAGTRVLVGAAEVVEVGGPTEWDYSREGPLRSIMWERSVVHTVRSGFDNGFLLPYQQLLADPKLAGQDLTPYLALAPGDHFDEFSYVSEHVSHDAAIAALLELARVVDLLPGVVDGPWDKVAAWIASRLADAWEWRGPYPGLGAALTAAGLERGAVIAHRVVESLDASTKDPWPSVSQAVIDGAANNGVAAGLVGRMALKAWERLTANEERFALVRLLARFSLTTQQARRLLDPAGRGPGVGTSASDGEILSNPYLLYELDRGHLDAVGYTTIDRGMFPQDASARALLQVDPLPDPVSEASDDRRVRAACVHILERAAQDGHTLLDEPGLRRRLAAMDLDPACDPNSDIFALAAESFPPVLHERPLARNEGRGWQLDRLADVSTLIAREVASRVDGGPIGAEWDWRQAIDEAIAEPMPAGDADEELARSEKAGALAVLARSRVAALVGPAGTGKTTMLSALCAHPDVRTRGVLLLAPTGKARVQLGDKVGAKALTLAQFLRKSKRWNEEFGYRLKPEEKREGGSATVVVDEASMLTEEMLAALIDATTGVERLILCGDHRQLPPIGPGRPFADLVAHLRNIQAEGDEKGGGVAELTVGRRQRASSSGERAKAGIRDDLAVASWFALDGAAPAADEAFARVLSGAGDGTLEIISWEDEDDLHRKVVEFLASDPELQITPGQADALKRSLGALGTYNGRPSFEFGSGAAGAERWQILTPVRSRPGGVAGLNRLVRQTWRSGDATQARRSYQLPPPVGADEVLFHDKVMCVSNHRRDAYNVATRKSQDGDVANGEIGMAVWWYKRQGLKVEFSTQPGFQFTFWVSELNAERERAAEYLELAYAVTVHKAQGSQFEITLVVVPNPCPLLSPELLYTALTRHRSRTIVFVQGDPQELRRWASPTRSETARRLTCLFRPADPFQTSDGRTFDASHIHRTANGELVRSKSEVIVANTLRSLGVEYLYEEELRMSDGSWREPDFTIARVGRPTIYWEHLGMLDKAGYRADWEAKLRWYESHSIKPWEDGGGPAGVLVRSTEKQSSRGIDAEEIEQLAKSVLDI